MVYIGLDNWSAFISSIVMLCKGCCLRWCILQIIYKVNLITALRNTEDSVRISENHIIHKVVLNWTHPSIRKKFVILDEILNHSLSCFTATDGLKLSWKSTYPQPVTETSLELWNAWLTPLVTSSEIQLVSALVRGERLCGFLAVGDICAPSVLFAVFLSCFYYSLLSSCSSMYR